MENWIYYNEIQKSRNIKELKLLLLIHRLFHAFNHSSLKMIWYRILTLVSNINDNLVIHQFSNNWWEEVVSEGTAENGQGSKITISVELDLFLLTSGLFEG